MGSALCAAVPAGGRRARAQLLTREVLPARTWGRWGDFVAAGRYWQQKRDAAAASCHALVRQQACRCLRLWSTLLRDRSTVGARPLSHCTGCPRTRLCVELSLWVRIASTCNTCATYTAGDSRTRID